MVKEVQKSIRHYKKAIKHEGIKAIREGNSFPNEGRLGWVPFRKSKTAFTLAEVLITLSIIGVVAAITIPGLAAKITDIADKNHKKVVETKIIQGLNLLDVHGGINNTYSSTLDFAKALSKYLKIISICDGTNKSFRECIPYNQVSYTDVDKTIKTIDTTELGSIDKLGLGGTSFMPPVTIVLADGTPVILSYKRDCVSDPDSLKSSNKSIHECVAGAYDLNRHRKPNMFGKDLITFNGAHVGIFSEIGEYYLLAPGKIPAPKDCSQYIGNPDYPMIKVCPSNGETDYWVGALAECKQMGGHLPDYNDMGKIAKEIFPTGKSGWDEKAVAKLGINQSYFTLWLPYEYEGWAIERYFTPDCPNGQGYAGRIHSDFHYICIISK